MGMCAGTLHDTGVGASADTGAGTGASTYAGAVGMMVTVEGEEKNRGGS